MEGFETDPDTGERSNSILLMDEPHHSRVRPPIAKALMRAPPSASPWSMDHR